MFYCLKLLPSGCAGDYWSMSGLQAPSILPTSLLVFLTVFCAGLRNGVSQPRLQVPVTWRLFFARQASGVFF